MSERFGSWIHELPWNASKEGRPVITIADARKTGVEFAFPSAVHEQILHTRALACRDPDHMNFFRLARCMRERARRHSLPDDVASLKALVVAGQTALKPNLAFEW